MTKRNLAGSVSGVALLMLIAALDLNIGSAFSFSTVYLLPVCLVTWFSGRLAGMLMSAMAASAWLLAAIAETPDLSVSEDVAQSGSRLIFYMVTALLVDRVRNYQHNLESLVKGRTAALQAEVARRQELERIAVDISEREQQRVAHELHDGLAAYLTGLAFRIKTLMESLERREQPEAADARQIVQLVNGATNQVRNLARLLAPAEDQDVQLGLLLSRLGAEIETAFEITCLVEVSPSLPELSGSQVRQLYRIAQEAVRNAVQHSKAELVSVSVSASQTHLILAVECDGEPFEAPKPPNVGLGLRIMRYRTEQLGGKLSIQAGDQGGAVVRCEVPIHKSLESAIVLKNGNSLYG